MGGKFLPDDEKRRRIVLFEKARNGEHDIQSQRRAERETGFSYSSYAAYRKQLGLAKNNRHNPPNSDALVITHSPPETKPLSKYFQQKAARQIEAPRTEPTQNVALFVGRPTDLAEILKGLKL